MTVNHDVVGSSPTGGVKEFQVCELPIIKRGQLSSFRTKTNVIFGVCLFVFSKLFTLSSDISIQKPDLE